MDNNSLSADAFSPDVPAIFAELRDSLPRTAADTEDTIAARARSALEAVLAPHPEDAFAVRLAVRVVTADAHAMDAFRGAAAAVADPGEKRRCRAQATSMARVSDSALRTLRRMQAERDKAFNAGHPATLGRAGYWFKEISVPARPTEAEPARAPAVPSHATKSNGSGH